MTDISTAPAPAAAPADPGGAPPPAAPPVTDPQAALGATPPPPAAAPPAAVEAPAGGEFDQWADPAKVQAHVKELRDENADYRRKWQPLERAFEGHSDGDRQVLTTLVQYLADPEKQVEAAEWMVDNARTILGDRFDEVVGGLAQPAAAAADAAPEVQIPTDPVELQKWMQDQARQVLEEERKAQDAQKAEAERADQQLAGLRSELVKLGYTPVAENPEDPGQAAAVREANIVCGIALDLGGMDHLQAAHEQWQEMKAGWGRETFAKLPSTTAAPSPSGMPAPTTDGGPSPIVRGMDRVKANKEKGLYGGR